MRQLANKIAQAALLQPTWAMAASEPRFGFHTPQTPIARQTDDLHAVVLGICILIAVVVFGIMFYSILKHRKAPGRESSQFSGNKPLEIVWTVIPCLIVAGIAYPATRTVIERNDAIPRLVRDAWFKVETPGTYRSSRTELYGNEHGFIPIVVGALPEAAYQQRGANQRALTAAASAADAK